MNLALLYSEGRGMEKTISSHKSLVPAEISLYIQKA